MLSNQKILLTIENWTITICNLNQQKCARFKNCYDYNNYSTKYVSLCYW